jgi:hypothetical protein
VKADIQGPLKKSYEKPKLRVYGDIRAMTQTSRVQMGNTDANPAGNRKTA